MRLPRAIAGLFAFLSGTLAFAGSPKSIDFDSQVVPVLTRSGCNTGACHGASVGRGGFRLSLLGGDPSFDFATITQEFKGRRIHLVHPERSLLLRKPSKEVEHGGGLRLPDGSEGHHLILDWIGAGAERDPARTLARLELDPPSKTVDEVGGRFQVRIVARWADGASDDVTRWAVLTPDDPASVRCLQSGQIEVLRRGRHNVLVRFMNAVASVTAIAPFQSQPINGTRPRANFVDDHINRGLDELRLPHSQRASDAALVRRLFLDLCGSLPDPAEVDAFGADRRLDKFERLVERLLGRPEFVDYWSYQWGDLLRIESRRLGKEGAEAFHRFVHEQFEKNSPLDQVARTMLLATGDSSQNGPANFSRVPSDPRAHAEYFSLALMGVRLQCANCHNHPLDRWTQDDYHGLAAIFARVDRGRVVGTLSRGEVIHPRTGKPADLRIPGENGALVDEAKGRLADWLTALDNPYFARAMVNRIWRSLMGRGLVEPIDDHRATNPPTNPQLLDALARDFVEHGFNLRHAIGVITSSEAYRRSAVSVSGNEIDDRFYSKALVRPMPPVVLVDAVSNVTGITDTFEGREEGIRAVQLNDARVPSLPLELLGRCSRDGSCESTGSGGGGLPLALHAINGPWLNQKVSASGGRLATMIASGRSDNEIVNELYRLAFSRPPTEAELSRWRDSLAAVDYVERENKLEDFLWALLNATEFVTNH